MISQSISAARIASWRCELALASDDSEKSENHYEIAIQHDPDYVPAYVGLGNLYIENRRFLEATSFLKDAYARFNENEDIAVSYYMSLRRQGLTPESIRICKKILIKHPKNNFIKSEMAVALVMSGNAKEALQLWDEGFSPTLRWQEWLPVALHAEGRFAESLMVSKESVSLLNESPILKMLYMRSKERSEPAADMVAAYKRFVDETGCKEVPKWSHYELLRSYQPGEALPMFDEEPETPMAIDPVPYCPRGVGLSTIHYDLDKIKHAKASYVQPEIERGDLSKKIQAFRNVSQELIDEGHFKRFSNTVEAVKERYWKEGNDPTYVMSTGRCGTLALYKFFKRSKRVVPYHTMHWQLLPPDRNHILYRVLSGKLDKAALLEILTSYLENRIAEYCFAYQDKRTPVVINHWDTVFSPFIAQLFPKSQFLHMWREEAKVFESIYGKNQFQNEQLRHCYFDPEFPDGKFECFFDQNLDMAQQITWYLFLTKQYSLAFMDTLEEGRMISMTSEQLFTRDEASFNDVKRIAHIVDLDYNDFCDAYARPINQKSEKRQAKKGDVSEISQRVPSIMEQLEKDCCFK